MAQAIGRRLRRKEIEHLENTSIAVFGLMSNDLDRNVVTQCDDCIITAVQCCTDSSVCIDSRTGCFVDNSTCMGFCGELTAPIGRPEGMIKDLVPDES